MAWTQADADAVRAAIVKLVAGERAVSVSYSPSGGSSRSVTYAAAQLSELRSLLAEMEAAANDAPRFRRAAFSKGFYPPRDTDE